MMKFIAIFITILMVSMHYLALVTTAEDLNTVINDARRDAAREAYTAINDARRDAASDTGFIWYCGGCAYLVTAFTSGNFMPTPPTSRLLGESYEYILVYNREYEKAASNSRLKKIVIGGVIRGCLGPVLFGCLWTYDAGYTRDLRDDLRGGCL